MNELIALRSARPRPLHLCSSRRRGLGGGSVPGGLLRAAAARVRRPRSQRGRAPTSLESRRHRQLLLARNLSRRRSIRADRLRALGRSGHSHFTPSSPNLLLFLFTRPVHPAECRGNPRGGCGSAGHRGVAAVLPAAAGGTCTGLPPSPAAAEAAAAGPSVFGVPLAARGGAQRPLRGRGQAAARACQPLHRDTSAVSNGVASHFFFYSFRRREEGKRRIITSCLSRMNKQLRRLKGPGKRDEESAATCHTFGE